MDNRTVHGHIHNYKDFTLVHGHLHSNQQNEKSFDDSYKHFEFINLNKNVGQIDHQRANELPISSHSDNTDESNEYPSLKMLMEECHCDPQIIEICCENSDHNADEKSSHECDIEHLEPVKKKVKSSKKDNLIEYTPKDLLFLDDCNTENKQTSKDVLMNFLDISKMYDIPVLNKTHGKIVHQENLLNVGFTKKEESLIENGNHNHNHHHHKLELHTHRMHNQVKNEELEVDQIKKKIDQEKHSLDCHFVCESPNSENFEVKSEEDKSHLDFKWNDLVSADKTHTTKCKWENCDRTFNSLMELHSHLIFDHLHNSKKHTHNNQNADASEALKTTNDDERCFWDNCGFEYQNDCDIVEHINDTHGIQFNIQMNPLENALEARPNETHRHNILMLPQILENEFVCKWKNCGVTCKNEEDLDEHLASHIPKRQAEYQCCWSECGKFFKQRQKILRHLKSHSKYKGCVCDLCNKTFSTSDGLLYHKKKMHKIDEVEKQNTHIERNIANQ
ncbi:hypothetical protein FOG51_00867 [Hanseniaspora uvarum]|nr:hypothetical protein FOG51_00867 [Hanseniaspora uvarum]KKA02077.1 Zinc-responsive transcriptional regulator HuZAP1 [Hanseniaspora uvarum DSM 2768]